MLDKMLPHYKERGKATDQTIENVLDRAENIRIDSLELTNIIAEELGYKKIQNDGDTETT